jgi:hypothetical protein
MPTIYSYSVPGYRISSQIDEQRKEIEQTEKTLKLLRARGYEFQVTVIEDLFNKQKDNLSNMLNTEYIDAKYVKELLKKPT